MEETEVKKVVREGYAKIAQRVDSEYSCCGGTKPGELSRRIGYSEDEIEAVPEGANLSLGCGNPVAIASLKEGETVLDLGSGGGFDCFLAAGKVGAKGKVIGVDMTPEMIDRARRNARAGSYQNVEFRLGEIENLPAADSSIDVTISNCVINLSPDKRRVFAEAYRVLKPGGRFMVSDIVLLGELPEVIKSSIESYIGCLAGAIRKDEYLEAIAAAGFREVRIVDEMSFPVEMMANDPTAQALLRNLDIPLELMKGLASLAVSVRVSGVKPA